MEKRSQEDLRAELGTRLASHPPGLVGKGARMGAAFHSEILCVLDVMAIDPDKPWELREASAQDAPATPFPDGGRTWHPRRFSAAQAIKLAHPLTLETLPGMPLRHRNGGTYTGVALARFNDEMMAIYASPCGIWWARPWHMFADGRFTPDIPQLVSWRNTLESQA